MDLLKLLFVGLMVIFSLFGTISAQCGLCTMPDDGGQCSLQQAPNGKDCGRKSIAYFVY